MSKPTRASMSLAAILDAQKDSVEDKDIPREIISLVYGFLTKEFKNDNSIEQVGVYSPDDHEKEDCANDGYRPPLAHIFIEFYSRFSQEKFNLYDAVLLLKKNGYEVDHGGDGCQFWAAVYPKK